MFWRPEATQGLGKHAVYHSSPLDHTTTPARRSTARLPIPAVLVPAVLVPAVIGDRLRVCCPASLPIGCPWAGPRTQLCSPKTQKQGLRQAVARETPAVARAICTLGSLTWRQLLGEHEKGSEGLVGPLTT
jgi:hypothetical protein